MKRPSYAPRVVYTYSVAQLSDRRYGILRAPYGDRSGEDMMTAWELWKTFSGSRLAIWTEVQAELRRLRRAGDVAAAAGGTVDEPELPPAGMEIRFVEPGLDENLPNNGNAPLFGEDE